MKKILKFVGISIGVLIVCMLVAGGILMRYGFKTYTLTSYNIHESAQIL